MQTTIHIYSHHFVVKHPNRQIIPVLYGIAADYTRFSMQWCHRRKKNVWSPEKTYGICVGELEEFRFHIGQYVHIEEQFRRGNLKREDYVFIHHDVPEGDDVELKVREGWVLREDQSNASNFILNSPKGERTPLLSMPTGSGKAIALETPIKVPGGWKPMGAVHLGDYVTAWDGTPSLVIGEYPQPSNAIYRITFGDGRSTECCIDHLWYIHASDQHYKSRVVSTKEIARLLTMNTYKGRLFIDLPLSEDGPDIALSVDPYILGTILGDGSISHKGVSVAKPDKELFDNIRKRLPKSMRIGKGRSTISRGLIKRKGIKQKNPIVEALNDHDLQGKRSWEKHIPEIYLHGSRQQRLDLVRGLLDTDGTVDKDNGTVSFTSTSKQLAESFQYLIRSLGGLAKMTSRFTFYTYKDEKKRGREAYTVFVRYKKPSELFLLSRKGIRTKDDGQYTHRLKLKIVSVEYSRHAVSKCIAIDHPDKLYVINDFIVTHNTVTSLVTASKIGKRLAVFVLGRYMDKWVDDIQKTYDISKKEICVIRGNSSLLDASHWVSGGSLSDRNELPKVFIISINTISVWAKHYCDNPHDPTLEAYGCQLYEFINELGIGTVIFDEVHQHLYAVYRILCFMNVDWAISLSATLLSKDMIIDRVQHAMFPRHARFEEIKMEKYINCYACSYQVQHFANARIQIADYGSTRYSHTAFETSLLKHKTIGKQYIDMIVKLVRDTYHDRYMKDDKCIVFVAMANTAAEVKQAIKHDDLLKSYDTRTYLESDPYENAMEPDIIVSTVLSAGTALDIPNLRVAIMTISVDSPVSNLQTLGRLRKLKDRDVHFYYLFCGSIPKHVEYHQNKVELFKNRVACHKTLLLPPLRP